MKNIFIITKREFLTQVRKRSFILLTLLAPMLMVGFGVLISMMFRANRTANTFNVIDKSGIFINKLKSDDDLKFIFVPESSEKQMVAGLKDMAGTSGLLIIPSLQGDDFDKLERDTRLLTNTKIGFDTKKTVAKKMADLIKIAKIKRLGLSEDQLASLDKPFDLNTTNVVENDKSDNDLAFGVKSGLAMVLMYATFMFIIIYGVRVMRSVLEEKNNRVVEIIISSVKPFELMMGKILGVTLVALTQFAVWIAMTVAGALLLNRSFRAMPMGGAEGDFDKLDIRAMATDVSHTLLDMNFPLIIAVFIVFFLLGYIFYSSIYAAIGSAVDNETETQQFTFFAFMPLMLGLYGSFNIMNNPDGPMAFWLSVIPFTSPVAMIARIPFGVPAWQILLSVVLLLATTLLMVYVAAKVYRVGILMYGNKATPRELWRWIRS